MTGLRRALLLLFAVLAASGLAASAVGAVGFDYSYLKKGTYKGTAVIPAGPDYVAPKFAGGRYSVSFRLTSPSRKGIRFVRGLSIGPVPALCNKPSGVAGKADEFAIRTLPRQVSFPATSTNGFILRSFVLRGGRWKPTKHASYYSGPLPHVDLGFVFNRNPTRFNPNPISTPSVSVIWQTDDAGNLAADGAWHCTAQSVVTVRLKS